MTVLERFTDFHDMVYGQIALSCVGFEFQNQKFITNKHFMIKLDAFKVVPELYLHFHEFEFKHYKSIMDKVFPEFPKKIEKLEFNKIASVTSYGNIKGRACVFNTSYIALARILDLEIWGDEPFQPFLLLKNRKYMGCLMPMKFREAI